MKSAYEIAMERLREAGGDERKLSDAQKAAIAELDNRHEARVAELRISYESKIAAAPLPNAREALRAELAAELRKLDERRDQDKEKIWNEAH